METNKTTSKEIYKNALTDIAQYPITVHTQTPSIRTSTKYTQHSNHTNPNACKPKSPMGEPGRSVREAASQACATEPCHCTPDILETKA